MVVPPPVRYWAHEQTKDREGQTQRHRDRLCSGPPGVEEERDREDFAGGGGEGVRAIDDSALHPGKLRPSAEVKRVGENLH